MIATFDPHGDGAEIEALLNDQGYVIEKIENYITEKGFTGCIIDYRLPVNDYDRMKSPYRQKIQTFFMRHGLNVDLNILLSRRDVRVIERLYKLTEIGEIVLLHYEIKTKTR